MINYLKKFYHLTKWYLAKYWLKLHPHVQVIGITGSVGKTTTKEVISSILIKNFKVVKTMGNLEPMFNIPISILKIRASEKFVVEMGVDGFGQIKKYLELVQPQIGILTRLSLAHTDENHFGSLEGLISEKRQLIDNLPGNGWAILNGDDEQIRKLDLKTRASVIFYGYKEINDVQICDYQLIKQDNNYKTIFTLKGKYFNNQKFETNLLGKHQILIATIGVIIGGILKMDYSQVFQGLSEHKVTPNRLEIKRSPWGMILDDSYNASPEAVKAAIDVLTEIDKKGGVILGDMLELGEYAVKAHYEVGRVLAEKDIPKIAVIGDYSREVKRGFLENNGKDTAFQILDSHQKIIDWVKKVKPKTLLIKGSRKMHLEQVVNKLIAI